MFPLAGESYYVVDAFASNRWEGNPGAIVMIQSMDTFPNDDGIMLKIAREFNLSETGFLIPSKSPVNEGSHRHSQQRHYNLRWFTPTQEIELCGHCTLASAHVLFHELKIPASDTLHFHTLSGELVCSRETEGSGIQMSLELLPPIEINRETGGVDLYGKGLNTNYHGIKTLLQSALGLSKDIVYIGKSKFDILVEIAETDDIHSIQPDLDVLKTIHTRAFIVTQKSTLSGIDFVSRVFAPAAGVPEDPVTGSAHCVLGPYWQSKMGRSEMTAFQAYPGRGGTLKLKMEGDQQLVHMTGDSVTVMKGVLM